MSHKKLRPFIVKVSVLGYFPLYTIYYIPIFYSIHIPCVLIIHLKYINIIHSIVHRPPGSKTLNVVTRLNKCRPECELRVAHTAHRTH